MICVNYQLVGRLDNSAISATGAKMAFKSNEEIAVQVKTIPLDEVIRESERVLIVKIDVQGWEYHVLKGATKLLSRKKSEAPYLIYEEDERLLQASNSSAGEIREFLRKMGYDHCIQHGTDAHCTKTKWKKEKKKSIFTEIVSKLDATIYNLGHDDEKPIELRLSAHVIEDDDGAYVRRMLCNGLRVHWSF